MAISLEPFERQARDFAEAIESGKQPLVDGKEGYATLIVQRCLFMNLAEPVE